MPYVMPIQRHKAALLLARSLRQDGPVIAEKLAPRMSKVLEEGEELPDVAHLLDVLGRMVLAEQEEIYDADDLQVDHHSDRSRLKRELKEVVPTLRKRVIEVRDSLRHNYGTAGAKRILGFEGRTPRATADLKDLATIMVRFLPVLKPKQQPGGEVDPAKWADYLKPPLEKTSELLQRLHFKGDAVEIAAEAKNKIMVAFDKTYRRVLRLAEMFYLLACFENTARSLRHKGGRPAEKIKSRGPSGVA